MISTHNVSQQTPRDRITGRQDRHAERAPRSRIGCSNIHIALVIIVIIISILIIIYTIYNMKYLVYLLSYFYRAAVIIGSSVRGLQQRPLKQEEPESLQQLLLSLIHIYIYISLSISLSLYI